jgi:hypothetical protein
MKVWCARGHTYATFIALIVARAVGARLARCWRAVAQGREVADRLGHAFVVSRPDHVNGG